ncbi:MAG TPA: hypothetical protein VFB96_13235 [Pirellulaceae bacterium]|nr:hypothetical protein [Pirellulaceae bacterium]
MCLEKYTQFRPAQPLLVILLIGTISPCALAEHGDAPKTLTIQVWPTFGIGGATRPPTIDAGDTFTAAVLVDGLKTDSNAQVDISSECRLVDENGKLLSGPYSARNVPHLSFGGTASVHYYAIEIPSDCAPGKYRARVEVTDHIANMRATKDLLFTIFESQYGARELRLAYDQAGITTSAGSFVVGQKMYVHYKLTNFATVDHALHVKNTLTVLTEAQQPVGAPIDLVAQGQVRMFTDSDELPGVFHLNVNSPGRFVLRITFNDELAKRERVVEIPVVCLPADISSPHRDHMP